MRFGSNALQLVVTAVTLVVDEAEAALILIKLFPERRKPRA